MPLLSTPSFRNFGYLRHLVAICALALICCGSGHAQSLPGIGGENDGGPLMVERETVRETAAASFSKHVSGAVGNEDSPNGEEVSEEARKVEQRYGSALDTALDRLESDGMLVASEVTERLGDLRDSYEQELQTVLTAVRDGYPPPPLRTEDELTPEHAKEMLKYTTLVRNSPLTWLYFLGCLIGGVLLAWALNLGAYRFGERIGTDGLPSIGSILRSLAGPLYLVAIGMGLQFGFEALWVPSSIHGVLQGTISVILVSALFWFFWNASPGIATGALRLIGTSYTTEFDAHAHNILLRLIRVAIIVILVLVVVRLILDSNLSSILTGLGVLGVALYFILRGTVENIAASFTLFSDQPFRVGDMVIYNDEWGTIEDIGFRSTEFRNFDGYLITIPNSELIDIAIVNAGARGSIRRRFRIGLTYHTPPEKVREAIDIIRDILKDHEGMPEDLPPRVEFEQFGAYDLQILIQYFYAPPDYWEAMAVDTKINLAIVEKLAAADIDIAFPTETHIVEGSHREQPVQLERGPVDAGDNSKPEQPESAAGKAPNSDTPEKSAKTGSSTRRGEPDEQPEGAEAE